MHPVLLEWRGVRVHTYSALLYLGLTLGIVVGNGVANVAGLDTVRVYVAMLLLAAVGLVGARLLFIVTHWPEYRNQRSRIWRRSEGGASMQGGLPLAVLGSAPLLWALGLPFWAFWDVATYTSLVWAILGRAGCLMHGCCGGRPTNSALGLMLPDERGVRQRRVPSQILEAGWAVLILLMAAVGWPHRPLDGAVFLGAVAAYALGRCALQPTRAVQDRIRTPVGSLDVSRALAAGLAAVTLIGLLGIWLVGHRGI